MNPRAAFEGHEARLQRVGGPRRNDRPGERARPGFVWHMPGWVDFLPFDLVKPGGGFEPFHAHRDFVGVREFEVVIEAQPEIAAVDDDVGRLVRREFSRADRRLEALHRDGHAAAGAAGYERVLYACSEAVAVDLQAVAGRNPAQSRRAR